MGEKEFKRMGKLKNIYIYPRHNEVEDLQNDAQQINCKPVIVDL